MAASEPEAIQPVVISENILKELHVGRRAIELGVPENIGKAFWIAILTGT